MRHEALVSFSGVARRAGCDRRVHRSHITFWRFTMDMDVDVLVMLFIAACVVFLMYIGI